MSKLRLRTIFLPGNRFLNLHILWCFLWFALSAYIIICLLDTPFRQLTELCIPPNAIGQTDEAPTDRL